MKTIKVALLVAVVAISGYNVYSSCGIGYETEIMLADIDALASSEKGCVNRNNQNNGDCTNDGTSYFCENSIWFHDCVKGMYKLKIARLNRTYKIV